MINYANKITISEGVANALTAGNSDTKCTFIYVNNATGKEVFKYGFSIEKALFLAESRRDDKRYKNYEFVITL